MFITERGMIVRSRVADISSMSRNTQGVRLVNLRTSKKEGTADRLVAVAVVSAADLERFGNPEGAGAEGSDGTETPASTEAPDTGAPDTGAPDTGAPDTGAPDAETPDAETPE